ncbi:MAG: winged helix DNA-binding domain-containing protein, partial [Rubrobacteraceae bacterium]
DVARQRLFNQRIEGERFGKPEEVVCWLGAVQAQDYAQALWAIGSRLRSATIADVERSIADGKIVRTWPMRGTIHFVPPENARWMLELCASRMLARDDRRLEQLDLDRKILERCKDLFYDALNGGERLSRPDVMRLLEDSGISTEKQRGYHILWYLAQSGLICMGPMRDKQQTFGLLDDWVPDSRELSREESLAELTRRYFAGHGPATVHDFARWAGLTIAETRSGIEAATPELVSEKIDGKEYWTANVAPGRTEPESIGVHLLPGFDEYVIGYKDRSAVLAGEHASRIVPGKNGVFMPVIVVDGRVVGTWKRKLKKNSIDVTLAPFAQLGESEERAVELAESYGAFIGLPVSSVEIASGY